MNKKALEMSFNVMFAIFAGIVILAIAIYATTQIVSTGEKIVSTETAAKIISLLDPLETGLASGKSEQINFKKETQIFFDCRELENPPFGKQTIEFSEKSLGDNFGERGAAVSIYNKYIFSQDIVQGKKLSVFSQEFSMPFKIADLIIINSGDYCFYQPPNEIQKEVENLNLKNIQFSDDLQNCTGTKVCFGSQNSECEIRVFGSCQDIGCESEYDYGRVSKDIDDFYYTDNLLYAAIFSSKDNYECNVKRLMNKFNELGLIYLDKSKITQRSGCSSAIDIKLNNLISSAKKIKNSKEIFSLIDNAKEIGDMNKATAGACRLY